MAGNSLQCYPGSMSAPDGHPPENRAEFAPSQIGASPSSLPDSGTITATLAKPPRQDNGGQSKIHHQNTPHHHLSANV